MSGGMDDSDASLAAKRRTKKAQNEYQEEVLRLSSNVTKARQELNDAEKRLIDLRITVKSSEQALDDLLTEGRSR